jgi:uncharacterized membrane protein required for colicin V production
VNSLDVVIILVALAAAVGGWRQGLVLRLITSAGAIGGVLLAAANVDVIAERLPGASSAPRILGVMGALFLGWFVGRLLGGFIGRWFRERIPTRTLQRADRLMGSVVGAAGVGFTLWLAAPVMFLLPGWPATVAFESKLIRTLDSAVGLAPLPIDPSLWNTARDLKDQLPVDLPVPGN